MGESLARSSEQQPAAAHDLRPSRIAIWPVAADRYGVDLSYHGPTGFRDAETAERALAAAGIKTTFRQELDSAWTVRFGPVPRDAMRLLLDRYAW